MTRSIFHPPRIRNGFERDPAINPRDALLGTDVSDRRRGDRQRVLKSATIIFNRGHCALSCHILDISNTGAKVKPSDVLLCPGEFVLQPRVGSARACEVVWRRSDNVGVRYI